MKPKSADSAEMREKEEEFFSPMPVDETFMDSADFQEADAEVP